MLAASAGAVLTAGGGAIALAEQAGPLDLPFDPHAYGDDAWAGMPPHVDCGTGDSGTAELILSVSEGYEGDGEIEVAATAVGESGGAVLWEGDASLEPGTWTALEIPIDERGLSVGVVGDGFNDGALAARCQTAPQAPAEGAEANTVEVPDDEGLLYFAAPLTENGTAVEPRWQSSTFVGFYLDNGTPIEHSLGEVSGAVEIPAEGLQIVVTDPAQERIRFDWSEGDPEASFWTFEFVGDPSPTASSNAPADEPGETAETAPGASPAEESEGGAGPEETSATQEAAVPERTPGQDAEPADAGGDIAVTGGDLPFAVFGLAVVLVLAGWGIFELERRRTKAE
ncbi:hypothetical protein [Gulosibacter sp. 10]|uniref:hypothetical protein n=1 Tax=Gulosibacter sp. 10 TaxID=1255570 RepID=UPI00097F1A59|nr:hypothetical protein [Gulosibacter sp. 10]SJM50559.1 hypothetical protein FM112_01470 [Gulosibacter sp. 10]